MVNFPEDWGLTSLGEVSRVRTGTRNHNEKSVSGKYPFFVRSATIERIDSYSYDTEAVLVPGEGNIGSIFHYIRGKFDVHQRVYVISEFPDGVSGQFVFWYMKYIFGDHALQNTSKATVDSLRLPVFRSFPLRLPQLKEQNAIAEVLSGFDEHLANLDELIAKKKNIRDGAVEELVTGCTRIADYQDPWREVPLDSIVHSRRESVGTELMSMDVELENIVPGEGRLVGDTSVRTASSFIFRTGDVLFGRLRPYLRKFWYATNIGVRSGEIWALVAKEEVDSKFLFHLVRTQRFLDSAGKTMGTKMPRADWNLMKSQRFCIPHSFEEQRAIAEVLSEMDEEIRLLVEERAKIELLKLGTMDDLLTGRVRLPIEEEAA